MAALAELLLTVLHCLYFCRVSADNYLPRTETGIDWHRGPVSVSAVLRHRRAGAASSALCLRLCRRHWSLLHSYFPPSSSFLCRGRPPLPPPLSLVRSARNPRRPLSPPVWLDLVACLLCRCGVCLYKGNHRARKNVSRSASTVLSVAPDAAGKWSY